MKTSFPPRIVWAILLFFGIGSVSFGDVANDAAAARLDAFKAFYQLTINSFDAVKAARTVDSSSESGIKALDSEANLEIEGVAVSIPQTTTGSDSDSADSADSADSDSATINGEIAVKIWFELPDGRCVNPTKKKWKSNERFFINIESAVPGFVGIYQNYPESSQESRQIYPAPKYSDSYKIVPPARPTRLPVLFQTDDDGEDETISFIFVRADWAGIQNGLNSPTPAGITNTNDNIQMSAQINSFGVGTMKSMNDRVATGRNATNQTIAENVAKINESQRISPARLEQAAQSINESSSEIKMSVVGAEEETSRQPNDVCSFLFGSGRVGHWSLTISK